MKEIPFSTILTALTNLEQAFPSRYLVRFSDLDSANLSAFLQAWPQVPLARKRALLKNLTDHFEDDTLVSFETIAAKLLRDEDAEVRTRALKLLDETIDTRLIPDLVKMIQTDPEPEARARAATVLGQFVRIGEMGELIDGKREMVEETLLKAAHNEHTSIARAALEALGYSSRPELDILITSAFNHPDPLWQAAALFAAGRSADNRWQEQIITGLLSEDVPVRLVAVQSAGELELKAARKPLLDMLEDELDDDVFQAIIWSLSQIGGEDVRTFLEALLAEAEDDDQIEYLEDAMANLSFTEDMEEFNMLAFDPDDEFGEDKE
ncbi:MAG: HEAT repeat domain-containing protein [Chloroflexi bacterium]|nr:HEAT repeat domain-containing protein [Chloroflexota bacterium]